MGIIVSPWGTSMTSPAAQTPSPARAHVVVDDEAARRADGSSPAAAASAVLGTLCRQTMTTSQAISPCEVATARTWSSPTKPSTAVPRCSVTPRLVSDSWTGSATSGSSTSWSTHGPSSMKCTSRPRWPRLPAISTPSGVAPTTATRLDRLEHLVELHRLADVLDVVQALEVGARHVRLLPHEAGGEDELVEALVLVARRDGAAVEVDVGDDRLHPHVQAVGDVAVDGRQEEVLEARDLAAVDERDAARGVGDVLELGVERHLQVGVDALGGGRRGDASAPAADDDEPFGHGRTSCEPAGGEGHVVVAGQQIVECLTPLADPPAAVVVGDHRGAQVAEAVDCAC